MQDQTTLFDRICNRLWLILAIGGAILAVMLFTAGAATAAGVAPWSNERLTVEVKKLKSQNTVLRRDIRTLQADNAWLQDFVLCHAEWDETSLLNENHTADDRAEACARIGL